jgi:multiple sugar transport system permease protein
MMLIFLAGLQNIPDQLYEAAEIDGAGRMRQFFNVTLPLLSPVIFFNTILTTIGSLRVFDAAFVLTAGGPAKSTLFYVYYLFNRAFVHFNMGYASAMAWLLFVIVLVLTIIQVRLGQKWVHYG